MRRPRKQHRDVPCSCCGNRVEVVRSALERPELLRRYRCPICRTQGLGKSEIPGGGRVEIIVLESGARVCGACRKNRLGAWNRGPICAACEVAISQNLARLAAAGVSP